MPLFEKSGDQLLAIEPANFSLEKDLQLLIEQNLEEVFSCRFVATEFPTGAQHAGRIDTLALSEDSNPVIIEYKKVESSELINQSLYYLHWVQDHRGDFEIAAQRQLGSDIVVDWSDIRVICLAPNYKKYDLHAVQVMGANIELWRYRLFKNNSLYLEEIFRPSVSASSNGSAKSPVMVEAGRKAAETRRTATYTFEQHLEGKPEHIRDITLNLQEFITNLDNSIEEAPKKNYIAYKASKNIACVEVQHRKVLLFLKLKPNDVTSGMIGYRDVSEIGHFGTGDAEFTLESPDDVEAVKPLVQLSFAKVGGA